MIPVNQSDIHGDLFPKTNFFSQLLWIASLWITTCSVLAFYRRIFNEYINKSGDKLWLRITLAFVSIWGLLSVVTNHATYMTFGLKSPRFFYRFSLRKGHQAVIGPPLPITVIKPEYTSRRSHIFVSMLVFCLFLAVGFSEEKVDLREGSCYYCYSLQAYRKWTDISVQEIGLLIASEPPCSLSSASFSSSSVWRSRKRKDSNIASKL